MSYGRARAPLLFETPTSFVGRDEFDQSAGALTGKTAPVGGVWAGAGDATDFTVNATADTAERNATTDATLDTGRFAISGASALTAQVAQVDFQYAGGASYQGAVARWTDTSNFIMFLILPRTGFLIRKRLAGVSTNIAASGSGLSLPLVLQADTWYSLRASVDAAGRWAMWVTLRGAQPQAPFVAGYDANFASGTLASGKPGIVDAELGTNSSIRSFDNFIAFAPSVNAAIHSTQSARFLHDIALRENAAGTSEGRVPVFEGKHLTAPPATRAARKSRIVVSARRFDVDSGLPDSGIADNLTGSLSVTPRVRLVSG